MHYYGININTLDKFITTSKREKKPWGLYICIADLSEYRLERFDVKAGRAVSFRAKKGFEATIFVEEGAVAVGKHTLNSHESLSLKSPVSAKIKTITGSAVYVFSGPSEKCVKGKKSEYGRVNKPFDYRDKYWGEIETIVSGRYAGKRIVVRSGRYASLEYHCKKLESYYIHSGKLLLRLRAGRGEDRFFEMSKDSATLTPPGLMHQRGGLEDTVIIEISTRDEDSDSFLVEDGAKHKMPQLEALRLGVLPKEAKKISFDIDGVICTDTKGDYKKAKPINETINFINKLYEEGFVIYIFTARFMGRNKNDWKKAYEEGYDFTKKQLLGWGVKHHDLFFGKPNTDIIVDDKALFYKPDVRAVEKEIRAQLSKLS